VRTVVVSLDEINTKAVAYLPYATPMHICLPYLSAARPVARPPPTRPIMVPPVKASCHFAGMTYESS
jgi:hypothetical protein